jgi:hypothetical protein
MEGQAGAEGMPPGAEAGAMPPGGEQLAAGTIINLFGKEFLVENKDDFFKMLRHLDSLKKMGETNNKLIREAADFISPRTKVKYERTKGLARQFTVNEMGGLEFNNEGKGSAVKLYEEYTKVVKGEKVTDYRTKQIFLKG